jgi:hypothetical protein
MNVHVQLYFAPLQTSHFLSFAATSLPSELMAIDATKERLGCACTCQQKQKKKRKKKENSRTV